MPIMSKILYNLSFMAIFLLLATQAIAETASIKGMGKITYSGYFEPASEDHEEAIRKAKINALERYLAQGSNTNLSNYELVRKKVESHVDDYILDYKIVSKDQDKSANSYTIVVRAEINVAKIANEIHNISAVANSSEDEKSYMTFIFVAREQTTIKKYDDKVFKRTDKTKEESGDESESDTGGNVNFQSKHEQSESTTSGGSTEKKANKIEYSVSSASEINAAMIKVFSTGGFEVVEAGYLEEETNGLISVDAFKSDYQHGDDISSKTKSNAAKGAKMLDVPYFAIGTLDVGLMDTDPSSGLARVYVKVTGKILDVKKRFPKVVASTGPVQYAGIGPNQTVAKTNALILAAENAAKDLASQLNARGVH